MATKREKELLALCKATYEHFTSDALQLAKRIVAMEKEIEESDIASPGASTKPILEINKPSTGLVTPLEDMVADPEIIGHTSNIAPPPTRRLAPQSAEAHNRSMEDLPF